MSTSVISKSDLAAGSRVRIKPQSGVGWKDQPLTGKEGKVTEVHAHWGACQA